jgi:polysaccharide deacetylase family protein (PEP-CTERM system associated)
MTVDVEDYFHANALSAAAPRDRWDSFPSRIEANTHRLLDRFAAAGVRVTCFVLGWAAERHPGLVRRIVSDGHELASHGFWHRLIYTQTPDEFREDIRRSKRLLEDLGGVAVAGYRAPSFSVVERSRWALDVLGEEGFTYDSSVFPIRHDTYGIPDAPRHPHVVDLTSGGISDAARSGPGRIFEVPASTVRVASTNVPVAGGGYFRLLPYGWTRWGIGRVNAREGRPVVFYLHPWEVDPDQPRLPVGALSRFRHYRNLDTCDARLARLLRDFSWAPVRQVWPEALTR